MEFEDFQATFSVGMGRKETWRVEGSHVYKNGQGFVDLQDVHRVATGRLHFRGSTSHWMSFETANEKHKLNFGEALSKTRNETHAELRRTIVDRYERYRPDGEVDVGGETTSRLIRRILGGLFLAISVAMLIVLVIPLNNGSEIATSPRWAVALFALMFAVAGVNQLRPNR